MPQDFSIALVDASYRRRAAIVSAASRSGILIEPFEGVDEYIHTVRDRAGLIIACDEDGEAVNLLSILSASNVRLPVIAYAQDPVIASVVKAIRAGAIDYRPYVDLLDDLAQAIAHNIPAIEVSLSMGEEIAVVHSRMSSLSGREKAVLQRLADGLTNKAIGLSLGISPRTVEIHRSNMMKKLGATNSPDAVRMLMLIQGEKAALR